MMAPHHPNKPDWGPLSPITSPQRAARAAGSQQKASYLLQPSLAQGNKSGKRRNGKEKIIKIKVMAALVTVILV